MAAAFSTEVPPNFITTGLDDFATKLAEFTDTAFMTLSCRVPTTAINGQQKTHRPVASGGGSRFLLPDSCLAQETSSRSAIIRLYVLVVVHMLIREFRIVGVISIELPS